MKKRLRTRKQILEKEHNAFRRKITRRKPPKIGMMCYAHRWPDDDSYDPHVVGFLEDIYGHVCGDTTVKYYEVKYWENNGWAKRKFKYCHGLKDQGEATRLLAGISFEAAEGC